MRIFIRKNTPSNGATALRDALRAAGHDARFSNRTGYRSANALILNWGDMPDPTAVGANSKVFNLQANRRVAMNKLATAAALRAADIKTPAVFLTAEAAEAWRDAEYSQSNRAIVLARSTTTGSGGEGITVVRRLERLPVDGVKYYSAYVPKRAEYRVHVFNGQAICVQQKRGRIGIDRDSHQALIRSHANGWVFAVNDLDSHATRARPIAIRAVEALGLQFGAVDVIRDGNDVMHVLEVNTRPGLEGETTLSAYVSAIEGLANG